MTRRDYAQFCGLARALDVVGERWTLLIVRNLLLGPVRYGDLQRGLPGITTNLLAKRLREMEEGGLVERVRLSAGGAGQAYRLTELGRGLEPAIHALGSWGWKQLGRPGKGTHRSFEYLLVALRRRYRGNVDLAAELLVDGVPYHIVLSPDRAEIGRGEPARSDVRITGSGPAVATLFLTGVEAGARPTGIDVEGDPKGLVRLVDAFHRGDPEPPRMPHR